MCDESLHHIIDLCLLEIEMSLFQRKIDQREDTVTREHFEKKSSYTLYIIELKNYIAQVMKYYKNLRNWHENIPEDEKHLRYPQFEFVNNDLNYFEQTPVFQKHLKDFEKTNVLQMNVDYDQYKDCLRTMSSFLEDVSRSFACIIKEYEKRHPRQTVRKNTDLNAYPNETSFCRVSGTQNPYACRF